MEEAKNVTFLETRKELMIVLFMEVKVKNVFV